MLTISKMLTSTAWAVLLVMKLTPSIFVAAAFQPCSTRFSFRPQVAACVQPSRPSPGFLLAAAAAASDGTNDSKPRTSKIESLIRDCHDQSYPFRIVVIGNGAILETTSPLGPYIADSVSPKTGERLLTLASEDKSFEFHLKLDQIGKVTLTESKRGDKTMRIVRLVNLVEDRPMCSLILADSGKEAVDWFKMLTARYGYEVVAGD